MKQCEYSNTCKVYSGEVTSESYTTGMLKRSFCENPNETWLQCKHYGVIKNTGKEPMGVLPNDPREIDEIIASLV